ncbi:hypothetical protein ACWGJP_12960 [Microbacterium sp. NPDC055903]
MRRAQSVTRDVAATARDSKDERSRGGVMRSSAPLPGNPWPHDMSITVDESPSLLMELLWIREAHGLRPGGEDLPPLLTATPPTAKHASVATDTRDTWEAAWPQVWSAAVAHVGQEDHDPRWFDELDGTADGSLARAELLRRMVGPGWRDSFGDGAFADDRYSIWLRGPANARIRSIPKSLDESPEWRDLPSLIPAWRAGLTKIVTIPCSGVFARKVGSNALLMTDRTREDNDSYRRALDSFV